MAASPLPEVRSQGPLDESLDPTRVPLDFRSAPLLLPAIGVSAGIALDYGILVPLRHSLTMAAVFLSAWMLTRRKPVVALLFMTIGVGALAAAYHRAWLDSHSADDVGALVTDRATPVQLRGCIADSFVTVQRRHDEIWVAIPRSEASRCTLHVSAARAGQRWVLASGDVRIHVSGAVTGIRVGDEVELVGAWEAPRPQANPGEFDYAAHLKDQRIRAVVYVRNPLDLVVLSRGSEDWSLRRGIDSVRAWADSSLRHALPDKIGDIAVALVLGDLPGGQSEEVERFQRTGVIHVLAVSGQHLAILGLYALWVMALCRVRRQRALIAVTIGLAAYAAITGGRAPVVRPAILWLASSAALLLGRRVAAANWFALAWLLVALRDPTEIRTLGCQLSFLGVAVLYWCAASRASAEADSLRELRDRALPLWTRGAAWLFVELRWHYWVSLVVWLVAAPLVAARYNLASPVGILLGPPLVLLTALALPAGFLLLLTSAICWPLTPLFAAIVNISLSLCDALVRLGERLPGAAWWLPSPPSWWQAGFYSGVLALLLLGPAIGRIRFLGPVAAAWLGIGLAATLHRSPPDSMICSFLAVGHGGCAVIETPDGRVLLYDVGSISGPDLVRRQVAPFLWWRHIRRIDELFLSHADLDHFNGLLPLAERFEIGQVTCTPTFSQRDSPAVRATLRQLTTLGIPIRIVFAGDCLDAGELRLQVLHPPRDGPAGNENARSLVVLLEFQGTRILLTGDLEGPGLDRVLQLPRTRVDVLMAPHHGSPRSNIPALLEWAGPLVAVACQGFEGSKPEVSALFASRRIAYMSTSEEGAVSVGCRGDYVGVQCHQSGKWLRIGAEDPILAARRQGHD